ncbi:MAG: hypothetical protein J2P25_18960 [Nocardiopsaceae bacterium]|nr:hypothetical protein [Nocardiopsaceae bacterium]
MPISPQLTLVRRHTQPTAIYIARLTATATAAYLLALYLPGDGPSPPVLAPLTALLVLQASLYQTIRTGIRKVVAVTAGVAVAVTLSAFVGFNWWLLGLLTAGTLLIGYVLKLGDEKLDVPMSAILIFSTAGIHAAATGRLIDTLAGTAAGLAGGLIFAPLRVQTAREAVGDLAGRLAVLLDRMATDLGDEPDPNQVGGWLDEARQLRREIERVDDTLRQAEDSARLNPRILAQASLPPGTSRTLRGGLETLEYASLSLRFLANSVIDATQAAGDSPVRDADTRAHLAAVLTMLAAAVRTYGRLVRTLPYGSEAVKSALTAELDAARNLQSQLARHLEPRASADGGYSEWPVRGEILCHVDRLRSDLATGTSPQVLPPPLRRPRPLARIAPRLRPATTPGTRTVRPLRVYLERASQPTSWTSAHSPRKARDAALRGAKAVTGARSADILSMTERAGTAVAAATTRSGKIS